MIDGWTRTNCANGSKILGERLVLNILFRQEDAPQSIFSEKHEKKRSKLLLPEPQISDKELDDIIKIGHASDSVRELVDDNPTRLKKARILI